MVGNSAQPFATIGPHVHSVVLPTRQRNDVHGSLGKSAEERTWILLVVLVAATVVVVAAACVLAAQRWAPLSAQTDAKLRRAVVGLELAKASSRPARMVGNKLTADDKAALQARYLRRLQRFAGGLELQQGRSWDYARALREDEWDTRELTGCSGRVVYWDFLHRDSDGGVEARAGVEKRYRVVTWDAGVGRALPCGDWVTGVIINQYTLKRTDGVWKVFDSVWWRFYDLATRQLGTGP